MIKFPQTIHVVVEEPGTEEEWFMVADSLEKVATFGEKREVAVYERKEIIAVKATVEIVNRGNA